MKKILVISAFGCFLIVLMIMTSSPVTTFSFALIGLVFLIAAFRRKKHSDQLPIGLVRANDLLPQ